MIYSKKIDILSSRGLELMIFLLSALERLLMRVTGH